MFLPIELYESIIEQIAPDDPLRQSTILSPTRALPYIPAPQTYLFRDIIPESLGEGQTWDAMMVILTMTERVKFSACQTGMPQRKRA